MSDEQDKTPEGQPTEEAAIQKEAAEAKVDAVNVAAGGEAKAGDVQQPADIAQTAPAPGEKKPLSDEEKAALKAAALEKAAAAKLPKQPLEERLPPPAPRQGKRPSLRPSPSTRRTRTSRSGRRTRSLPSGRTAPPIRWRREQGGARGRHRSARSFAGDLTSRCGATRSPRWPRRSRPPQVTYLIDICGADYPKREPRFDRGLSPAQLRSEPAHPPRSPRTRLAVPTVCGVWRAANCCGREAYDMYGVLFEGHPDMTRILLWEGLNGYPLRKDFP